MTAPSRPPVLLHVGLHKTGTSWLQREFFSKQPGFISPWTYNQVYQAIVAPTPAGFDPEAARAALAFPAHQQGLQTPIISMERLSGHPHSGSADAQSIARRLAATFPDAHVWLALREQVAAIASNYAQYVRIGGRLGLEAYLRPQAAGAGAGLDLQFFEYLPLVQTYQQCFGGPACLFTTYEEFRQDKRRILRAVLAHAGHEPDRLRDWDDRPVNAGLSPSGVRWMRRFNRALAAPKVGYRHGVPRGASTAIRHGVAIADRWLAHGSAAVQLRSQVAAVVGPRYAVSNRSLSKVLGVDLQGLGYRT